MAANKDNIINIISKDIYKIQNYSLWSYTVKTNCSKCGAFELPLFNYYPHYICIKCIEVILKANLKNTDISTWKINEFLNAISSNRDYIKKLIVLYRFEEVLKLSSADDRFFSLLKPVAAHIGFIENHPLSSIVRNAAKNACLIVGELMIPILISVQPKDHLILYINSLITAGEISYKNKDVKAALKKAANALNVDAKRLFLNELSNTKSEWANEIIELMSNDKSDIISQRALNYLDKDNKNNDSSNYSIVNVDYNLIQKIKSIYKRGDLIAIYRAYFQKYGDELALDIPKDVSEVKLANNDLANAFGLILTDKKRITKFISILHEDVKKILADIIWDKTDLSARELDKNNKLKILNISKIKGFSGNSHINITINDDYRIFQFNQIIKNKRLRKVEIDYEINLDPLIRNYFKDFFPIPDDKKLLPSLENINTDYYFEDNGRILSKIRLICAYIRQGNIIYTKSDRPSKTSIRQFASHCDIIEFYDQPVYFEIEFLRTSFIIDFISGSQDIDFNDPLIYLKTIFNNFFNAKDVFSFELSDMISHLKGMESLKGYHESLLVDKEKKIRQSILFILKEMKNFNWTAISSIIRFINTLKIDMELVPSLQASKYLYYKREYGKDNIYRYGGSFEYVSLDNYKEIVLQPFIKAVMFFLASFGIVDIKFDYPSNTIKTQYSDFLSIYDGLKYVKLTEFGKYIIGELNEYKININEEDGYIALDENQLIATVFGNDIVKVMMLKQIGDPIKKDCFKITYQSFLKGCNTSKDIYKKISIFEQQITKPLPENWKLFLEEIKNRINPLKEVDMVKVFQVKHDKELISILATDDILKKYIVKAQDLTLIIQIKDIKNVKKRLESFGYFIDDF